MPDDYAASTSTTGTVTVGGSATGTIETSRDVDWFAVELLAGRTYVIDHEGAGAGGGTLGATMLLGVFDDAGGRASRKSRDGGEGGDARLVFTATETGTYYIAVRGGGRDDTGTYTVRVRERDPDAVAAGAADLGELAGERLSREDSVDGGDDAADYWRFTLDKTQAVTLSLRRQDANADLYLEDADGTVLHASSRGGTRREEIAATLEAGTYYVRVAARTAGDNDYLLRARAEDPAPAPPDPGAQTPSTVPPPSVPTNVSEPDGGDLPADTSTTGRIAVGGSATGAIAARGDVDWFATKLEAGKIYRIDVKGLETGDGTQPDPYLPGVYDAAGNLIAGSRAYVGGKKENVEHFLTVAESGTYYIAAGGQGEWDSKLGRLVYGGTYTVSVTEVTDDFAASTATTGTVAAGGSIAGAIETPDDRDWFRVTLEAGKTYRFDVQAGWRVDAVLHGIYDADGDVASVLETIANHDLYYGYNFGVRDFDLRAYFTPTKSGTYYVAASSGPTNIDSYRTGGYTLSMTEMPADFSADTATTGTVAVGGSATGEIETSRDVDWFAVTLEKGKSYRFDLKGSDTGDGTLKDPHLRGIHDAKGNLVAGTADDNGGTGANSRAHLSPAESGTYYVAAGGFRDHIGTYTVSALPATLDDYSANTATKGTVAVGGAATGSIEPSGDVDWFRTTLSAGTWYEVDLEGTGANPADENRLEIYDSNGNRLASDTTAGWGWDSSRLLFKAPADGTYYIGASEVRSNIDRNVHPDGGNYRLSVAVAQPAGYDEIAAFLTDGFWRAGGRRAFDLDSDRTLDVDITGLAANGQQLARWAFEAWSDATGIRFRFVDRDADIVLDDELGWSHSNTVVSGGKVVSGSINIVKFSRVAAVNEPYFKSYMHEIGHVLGLGHPGRYNGHIVFPNGNEFPNDTQQATVMSYFFASANPWNPAVNTFGGGAWYYPVTPMIADILAVRDLYGAPAAVHAGDTVYGWQGNVGGYLGHLLTELTGGTPDVDVYRYRDLRYNDNPVALTLYDTGGTDTLDLRTDTHDQRIDLRPEGVSTVFGRNGKIFIGPETVIENVVAGSGNDRITGNAAANRLEGRGGHDTLDGREGRDTLEGGKGDDRLTGGKGHDTLEGGEGDDRLTGGKGNDVFVFGPGNGADTVTDFANGKDKIDLRAFTAISGFSGVDAEAVSGGVEIDLSAHGGGTVLLEGFALADLDPGDFLFHG